MQTLLQWLNDSVEGRRIVIRDIVEDLYDGQILGELLCECRMSCHVTTYDMFMTCIHS